MSKVMIFPRKYVQGKGIIHQVGRFVSGLGKKALVLGDNVTLGIAGGLISGLGQSGIAHHTELFQGECTSGEIERVGGALLDKRCDFMIGIGGGKVIDTARASGFNVGVPIVVVPTTCSTSAPCSSVCVIYTEQHEVETSIITRNPDLVVVDTAVLAGAPLRFFVAGVGDAIATYYEAMTALKVRGNTVAGGDIANLAVVIAKTCLSELRLHALEAKRSLEHGVLTPSVERAIEAILLLGGIGFENGGLSMAHAIHNGLTRLHETDSYYHGEKIAFTTAVHMVLEDYPTEEIRSHLRFLRTMGLPATLAELGIEDAGDTRLTEAAEYACHTKSYYNKPYPLKPDDVLGAILTTDFLGRTE